MFNTPFSHSKTFAAPSGSCERAVKMLKVDCIGNKFLEVVGYSNEKEKICSFVKTCDLKNLVKRVQNGDPYALNQRRGFFADMSRAPKTLSECYSLLSKAENVFNNLNPDLRDKYSSFTDFLNKDFSKLIEYSQMVNANNSSNGGESDA